MEQSNKYRLVRVRRTLRYRLYKQHAIHTDTCTLHTYMQVFALNCLEYMYIHTHTDKYTHIHTHTHIYIYYMQTFVPYICVSGKPSYLLSPEEDGNVYTS